MKMSDIKFRISAALLAGAMLLSGCNDSWNDHYESDQQDNGMTLYQTIAADPELSIFKSMIDRAGYAGILNTTQTFTVWAPVNSALQGIDLDDEALVKRTIINHMARFNNSSAATTQNGVRMYNGKKFRFSAGAFGGVDIATPDILCTNGVLHTMRSMIPYTYNIREYIDTHAETSILAKFLAQFDEEIFDLENSTPLDVNENGETVYDSVKIQYNWLLDYPIKGIGSIADEDSTFTMVVPTDDAWTRAYNAIKPWFVTASDSITDVQTSLAVFSDMVFRDNITAVPSVPMLISTTGSEHTAVADIFAGAQYMTASNGSLWLTSNIGQNPLESWNLPLEIESETALTRKMMTSTNSYCTTYNVGADSEFADQISEMSYIYVSSTNLSNAGAEFTINNPLSGTYKIYAYFVPAVVDNPSATAETTRMKFTVTYPRSATTTRTESKNYTDQNFITSPTEVTEMYVGEVTFPTSQYVDRLRTMSSDYDSTQDESKFKITVQTNVTQNEFNAGTFRRSFRIDRIVLVPVI